MAPLRRAVNYKAFAERLQAIVPSAECHDLRCSVDELRDSREHEDKQMMALAVNAIAAANKRMDVRFGEYKGLMRFQAAIKVGWEGRYCNFLCLKRALLKQGTVRIVQSKSYGDGTQLAHLALMSDCFAMLKPFGKLVAHPRFTLQCHVESIAFTGSAWCELVDNHVVLWQSQSDTEPVGRTSPLLPGMVSFADNGKVLITAPAVSPGSLGESSAIVGAAAEVGQISEEQQLAGVLAADGTTPGSICLSHSESGALQEMYCWIQASAAAVEASQAQSTKSGWYVHLQDLKLSDIQIYACRDCKGGLTIVDIQARAKEALTVQELEEMSDAEIQHSFEAMAAARHIPAVAQRQMSLKQKGKMLEQNIGLARHRSELVDNHLVLQLPPDEAAQWIEAFQDCGCTITNKI